MKIRTKLITSYLVIALLLMYSASMYFKMSKSLLIKSVTDDAIFFSEQWLVVITHETVDLVNSLKERFHDKEVYEFIRLSNQHFDEMSDPEKVIDQLDKEWTSYSAESLSPYMQGILDNTFSEDLRQWIEFMAVQHEYEVIGEVFVTNKYGVNVIESRKTSDYNQSDEVWWQNAKIHGYYIEEPKYDDSSQIHAVAIATRLSDENGNFLGVVKILINVEMFGDLLDMAHHNSELRQMELYLLTNNNTLIYSTEQEEDLTNIYNRLSSDASSYSTEKKLYVAADMLHTDMLLNWKLIVSYPMHQMLSPVESLKRRMFILAAITLLIALFMGYKISQSISVPLQKLQEAAINMSEGNMDVQIDISQRNEIGSLVNSFITMRDAMQAAQAELKFTNENLEQTVEERLEEIKNTNQQLMQREQQLSMMNQSLTLHKQDLIDSNARLEAQKKQLQDILSAVSYPLYVMDMHHNIVIMNHATEELILDSRTQKSICCYALTRPDPEKCVAKEKKCPMREVQKGKKNFSSEHVYFNKKGQRRTVHVQAFPIFDDTGNVVQIVESCMDITELKETEYELKRARRNLQQLLDSMPIGIVLVSKNERITHVNQTAMIMTEYKHLHELTNMDAHQIFECDDQLEHQVSDVINNREENLVTKSMKKIPILKSVVPIRFDNQNMFLEAFIDITEYKAAEADKLRLESELIQARKLESIGTLAAGVAHEINTPIQFIGDNTRFVADAVNDLCEVVNEYQTLFSDVKENLTIENIARKNEELLNNINFDFLQEEIPQALRQTQEGIDQVSRIVRAMRDFSHVGGESTQKENINSAIETTITISRNVWKYVADIQREFDAELPLVNCCVGDIKQVVLNLIVNASHTIKDALDARGGEKGSITIKTYVAKSHAVIAITDTGVGIPDDIKDKVFDHFFTTKEVGKGTGQGLSMAYQTIVDKHKGKLWFDSVVNQGTTFYIALPID